MNEEGAAIGSPIDVGSVELSAAPFSSGGGRYAIAAFENWITDGNEESRLMRFVVDARRGSVTKLPIVETTNGHEPLHGLERQFIRPALGALPSAQARIRRHHDAGIQRRRRKRRAYSGRVDRPPRGLVHFDGVERAPNAARLAPGRRPLLRRTAHRDLRLAFRCCSSSAEAHGEPTLLSIGWSRQFQPLMASSPGRLARHLDRGRRYLTLYDTGSTSRRLLGMRTDAAGAFIDAVPFEIATGVAQAAVVFAGDVYVVAWQKWLSERR